MTHILKLMICFFIIFTLASCGVHQYGPFIGKVVDAENKEPIEGAAVHISFYTKTGTLAGATSHYAGSVECLTDTEGEFNLSYQAHKTKLFSVWDNHPSIIVFKPGYGPYPHHHGTNMFPRNEYSSIEKDLYCVISLPKLKTKKERRKSQGSIFVGGAPPEDMKIIRTLQNQERIYLGLEPYDIPNFSKYKNQ